MAVLKGEVTFKVTFTGLGVPVGLGILLVSFTKNVLNKFMHQHLGQNWSSKRPKI